MKTAFGITPKAVLSFELCSSAIGAGRELIRLVVERQRLAAFLAGVLPSAGLFSCFRHTITSAKKVVIIIRRSLEIIHQFGIFSSVIIPRSRR